MKNYLFTSESVSEGHPDKVCDKIITVSASTMTKISRGLVDVEKVAENKKSRNKDNILYRFN